MEPNPFVDDTSAWKWLIENAGGAADGYIITCDNDSTYIVLDTNDTERSREVVYKFKDYLGSLMGNIKLLNAIGLKATGV